MTRRTRGPGAAHEQRRREIADAVLAVVADDGLQGVSQNTVATRAGVSPGRVQHYFPARHGLIEAAFDRANALSSARISEKAGPAPRPRDAMNAVLTELVPHDAVTRTHLRIRQSFTSLALSDETIAARMRAEYERFHAQVAGLLRQDLEAGLLPAGTDPEAEAVALVALAEGLAYYVLIGVHTAGGARERIQRALAGLYP